ncbi:MAG: 3-oxoadipate enol-lactonase [Pseudomonadota bacterium]
MPGHRITVDGIGIHLQDTGPRDGAPLVLLHALGTDLRIWDTVVPLLPERLRVVRIDMRGHGLSDCPSGPYKMGRLVSDAEAIMEALALKDAVVLGLSIGGMIAQGLAVKRLDLVRGLILACTGAKIGTPALWADRIRAAEAEGLDALADATLARWFPEPFRSGPDAALTRTLMLRQPVAGWTGCAAAIAGTDYYTPTSGLRLPTLAIAGDRDGSTPPDLVRETAGLIPGARFVLLRKTGHLPCVDAAPAFAQAVSGFLTDIGHL